jgi:hypothetical protein
MKTPVATATPLHRTDGAAKSFNERMAGEFGQVDTPSCARSYMGLRLL